MADNQGAPTARGGTQHQISKSLTIGGAFKSMFGGKSDSSEPVTSPVPAAPAATSDDAAHPAPAQAFPAGDKAYE